MSKLLIIDDDDGFREMLQEMLEREGFTIFCASDGSEGIKVYEREKPDVVITDIIMPEKEGLETIREMKRMRPDLKIIAMSGGGKISADNYLETAKIFGASRILEKPFSQKTMVMAVIDLLGVSSGGDFKAGNDSLNTDLEKEQS